MAWLDLPSGSVRCHCQIDDLADYRPWTKSAVHAVATSSAAAAPRHSAPNGARRLDSVAVAG